MAQGKFSSGVFNRIIITGEDGLRLNDPEWLDIKAPFFGRSIDVSQGHIDYNKTELGIDFDDTSRDNEDDMIGIIFQMNHNYVLESTIRPHLHWIQEEDEIPNFLVRYRYYNVFDAVPGWTTAIIDSVEDPYVSGTKHQVSRIPDIVAPTLTSVSGIIDFKLFRDTANTTALFAGADPYSGDVTTKELDLHFQLDRLGSKDELFL